MIRDCQQHAQDAATAFRLGLEAQGSDSLVKLADALGHSLGASNFPLGEAQIGPWLQGVLAAQQRGDYLWIADQIEYQLIPALRG